MNRTQPVGNCKSVNDTTSIPLFWIFSLEHLAVWAVSGSAARVVCRVAVG
ncbi:hypothetical protein V2G26_003026 [Clonostachys chloroleuca]